jgi:Serine/threonine protein kinase
MTKTTGGHDPLPGAGSRPPAGGHFHVAFLTPETLELDLTDPEQRDFGDYELLERLGAGGMGVVYRARQRSLDREVAVKLLSTGPWPHGEYAERFRREARAAARLQHPNIVSIHEIDSQDGIEYYSMALVDGPSLATLLARDGPMAPRAAARLVRTIAEALHYAHRLGVLHLDLKPGNVLTDSNGEPLIADFGLARRIDVPPADDPDEVSGTPSYMAPEQITPGSHPLGVATDIYGLGAVLYELLTGVPPFHAPSPMQTLVLARDGRLRRPRRYRPDLPADLEAICLKCLARDPADRYRDAHALAEDLGRFLEGREVSVRPLNAMQRLWRWFRREPKLGGAILLAVLALVLGLGVALVQWERAEAGAAAAREQTWRTRGDAAWRLVGEGRHAEALPLLEQNLREREAHRDEAGAALERMRLGTLRGSGAVLVKSISTGAIGRALDIDRAGQRVATIDLDEVVRLYSVRDGRLLWQTQTGGPTRFTSSPLPPTRIRFSADGSRLVAAPLEPVGVLAPHGRNQMLLDAGDGRMLMPDDPSPDFLDATFDATGRRAVLRERDGTARLFDVDGWRPLTPPRRMPHIGGSWIIGDGGRFVARCFERHLELMDSATLATRLERVFDPAEAPTFWVAQPDGGLLALGHADGSVRLVDTVRLEIREVRPAPSGAVETMAFSRDGRWLLAAATGRIHIWDAASGHGGPLPLGRAISATRLEADAVDGSVIAFAPDDTVLWRLPEGPGGDLRDRISAARTVVPQLLPGNALPRNAGSYAPSANLIAVLSRDGELRLWRWRNPPLSPGRAPAIAAEEPYFDGRHVIVAEGRQVRVVSVRDGQAASPVLSHPQPVSFAAFAPGGRLLVTVSGRELRVFDWHAGRLLYPPIEFDDTPQRVLPARGLLFVHTLVRQQDRTHASASVFDLQSGRALARGVPLPDPWPGLRFSRDGRLLVHWRKHTVQVLDAASLRPLGPELRPVADANDLVIADAAIGDDGRTLVVSIDATQDGTRPRLVTLDAIGGRVLHDRELEPGYSHLLVAGGKPGLLLRGQFSRLMHWVDSDGDTAFPFPAGQLMTATASSADGRWLAVDTGNGILVGDRDGGEWAAVLPAPRLPLDDHVAQLVFADDASALLARSEAGRWVWWPLPVTGAAATVTADDPPPTPDPVVATPTDAAGQRQPPAPADPRLVTVDLAPAYNRPLDSIALPEIFTAVPIGRQRLLGVDFDIGGVVFLSVPGAPAAQGGAPPASAMVPPPRPRFDAVHVLLAACCSMPGNLGETYAYLVLQYADGSRARIPIWHQRDVWISGERPDDARDSRLAWVSRSTDGYLGELYAPRLANPHPERDVTGIAFEASEYFTSGPMIYAATLELGRDHAAATD